MPRDPLLVATFVVIAVAAAMCVTVAVLMGLSGRSGAPGHPGCTSNVECAGEAHGRTHCDVASGDCVVPAPQCTKDSQCTDDAKAQCKTGECVPCNKDAQCAGHGHNTKCSTAGKCVAPAPPPPPSGDLGGTYAMTLAQPLVGQHNLRIGADHVVVHALNGSPAAQAGVLIISKDAAGYTLKWQKPGGQPLQTYMGAQGGEWVIQQEQGTVAVTGVSVTKSATGLYTFTKGALTLGGGQGRAGDNDLNLGWIPNARVGTCSKPTRDLNTVCFQFTLAKQG